MKYELQKGAHSVSSLYVHFICVMKYRKNVFDPLIANRLKQLVCTISTAYEITIVEQEIDLDHIYILFSCSPTRNLPKYIRALQSSTVKPLRQAFPQLYQQLWGKAFGSPFLR